MVSENHHAAGPVSRRSFLKAAGLTAGVYGLAPQSLFGEANPGQTKDNTAPMTGDDLPVGGAPLPVSLPHFPDRLHAFVWRNWPLVPIQRMAAVVGARPEDLLRMGRNMGLGEPPPISASQQRRSTLSVIRRNWHLLPYDQLLQLLDWTAEQMAYTLREDDFLYVKLGNLKPKCEPLRYRPPDAKTLERERVMSLEQGGGLPADPLFGFVEELSRPPQSELIARSGKSSFELRFCYSYFALYGDPLLEPECDPYPEGLLWRLAQAGVNGVWLQGVLSRLAPFPWDPQQSRQYQERLDQLNRLVERARRFGIGIYLYLNEPRSMPLSFFKAHRHLRGVVEGDFAALCTSVPEAREYLASSIETIGRAAPGLAGFFTISGSENLSNCWSHGRGMDCPQCGKRTPAEVIAEANATIYEGIRRSGAGQKLIVWDWGWNDAWAEDIIGRLPKEVYFQSVSEWSIPIRRGGVETTVGEYSISTIGPGRRARRHWEIARRHGLKTIAKVQFGNTWELSAVPYIPALANVARHAQNLRQAGVDGLMLGWTLGGYPSPNLEVAAEIGSGQDSGESMTAEAALARVAERRFGKAFAPQVVRAWQEMSAAFGEFPYHGGVVYNAPMQLGPANLLWEKPTGYRATMVGFPYDDLDSWRAVYPVDVFINQLEKVAAGFEQAFPRLQGYPAMNRSLRADQKAEAIKELRVAEAAAIHFRSVANQARFVRARRHLDEVKTADEFKRVKDELERLIQSEMQLAKRLLELQSQDSRLGFEASNQYYYVGVDLSEKILNCRDLLTRWLPGLKWAPAS